MLFRQLTAYCLYVRLGNLSFARGTEARDGCNVIHLTRDQTVAATLQCANECLCFMNTYYTFKNVIMRQNCSVGYCTGLCGSPWTHQVIRRTLIQQCVVGYECWSVVVSVVLGWIRRDYGGSGFIEPLTSCSAASALHHLTNTNRQNAGEKTHDVRLEPFVHY